MALNDFINQKVRRTILMVKRAETGTYQHLFSVYEMLTDPLVEVPFKPNMNDTFIDFDCRYSSEKQDTVFFAIDECTLGESMTKEPLTHLYVGKDYIVP